MTKQHSRVLIDVDTLTEQQLIEIYDIEFNEDGTIYDPAMMRTFDTLISWAMAVDEEENEYSSTFIKRNGKHHFDDED